MSINKYLIKIDIYTNYYYKMHTVLLMMWIFTLFMYKKFLKLNKNKLLYPLLILIKLKN